MDSKEVQLLKRALDRQKKARLQAEKILEEKSKELYDVSHYLKEANAILENKLNEKTSELDGVFINIIDPYVVMDLAFNVINMNTSAKEFLGFDSAKQNLNLSKLIHPDFLAYTAMSIKTLFKVGILKNYRAQIIIRDGTMKWVQINCNVIYNKERKPIAAQGILRDITQEMEIKQLLSKQKKQLDIIVEHSPLGILLTENGSIVKANATATKLLYFEEFELINMNILDISTPENHKESDVLTRKLSDGLLERITLVKKFSRKDRSLLLAKTSISTVKNTQGETDYQIIIIEDIENQRAAENRLRVEKEKYGSIIANMNLGLIEVDKDDAIQLVNQSFCDMSGFKESELLGKKAAHLLQVKNRKIISNKAKVRAQGKSDSYEVAVLDRRGNRKHWLISGAPRYDKNNNIIGSIGIHLDITNQKLLELQKERLLKELELSNQGLQEYAHIVSHDLKSPLRSISALATWLYEDYKDNLDATGLQNLQLMQEKVASMDKLIHGILEYSTANSSDLDNALVDMNLVIRNIRETIFIPEHVTLEVPKDLPIILADGTKIQQVFQNIISNAVVCIKKEVGVVKVLCEDKNTHWQFTIMDNGVGIPKEYHKKIFEMFQSIGDSERSSGIGLSIVKKIVDRYGGEVWVESEMGIGTTFYFTLSKQICTLNYGL